MSFSIGDKVMFDKSAPGWVMATEGQYRQYKYLKNKVKLTIAGVIEEEEGVLYKIVEDDEEWKWEECMLKPMEDEEMNLIPRTMISDALEGKGLFDSVNRPQHYADRKYEVINVIQDSMSQTEFKGFLRGNVLKYVMRYDKKGGVQDLEKGEFYLKRLIDAEKEKANG